MLKRQLVRQSLVKTKVTEVTNISDYEAEATFGLKVCTLLRERGVDPNKVKGLGWCIHMGFTQKTTPAHIVLDILATSRQ
jgi:hypothetical protein